VLIGSGQDCHNTEKPTAAQNLTTAQKNIRYKTATGKSNAQKLNHCSDYQLKLSVITLIIKFYCCVMAPRQQIWLANIAGNVTMP
jgi:hypothetical protein